MDILLNPILDNISDMNRDGICDSDLMLQPKLLIGVFDLPAKSSVTNANLMGVWLFVLP